MRNASECAVQCTGISRYYGKVEALRDVSIDIPKGQLFGLIGADGAGKTTLIKSIATLLKPNKGHIEVLGYDSLKDFRILRHFIGYMPGKFSLYGDLTVYENLKVFATLHETSIKKNYTLFADIYEQLKPFSNRFAANLSGGMKQKLALCCVLVHRPRILLLDEPTTGVDPVSRHIFWDILGRLCREDKMNIIVSTPYMDEAFRCDTVALMQNGQIVAVDTPQNLVNAYPYTLWGASANSKDKLLRALRSIHGLTSSFSFGDKIHFTFNESQVSIEKIKLYLQKEGLEDIHIEQIDPSIEDYFLSKTAMRPAI